MNILKEIPEKAITKKDFLQLETKQKDTNNIDFFDGFYENGGNIEYLIELNKKEGVYKNFYEKTKDLNIGNLIEFLDENKKSILIKLEHLKNSKKFYEILKKNNKNKNFNEVDVIKKSIYNIIFEKITSCEKDLVLFDLKLLDKVISHWIIESIKAETKNSLIKTIKLEVGKQIEPSISEIKIDFSVRFLSIFLKEVIKDFKLIEDINYMEKIDEEVKKIKKGIIDIKKKKDINLQKIEIGEKELKQKLTKELKEEDSTEIKDKIIQLEAKKDLIIGKIEKALSQKAIEEFFLIYLNNLKKNYEKLVKISESKETPIQKKPFIKKIKNLKNIYTNSNLLFKKFKEFKKSGFYEKYKTNVEEGEIIIKIKEPVTKGGYNIYGKIFKGDNNFNFKDDILKSLKLGNGLSTMKEGDTVKIVSEIKGNFIMKEIENGEYLISILPENAIIGNVYEDLNFENNDDIFIEGNLINGSLKSKGTGNININGDLKKGTIHGNNSIVFNDGNKSTQIFGKNIESKESFKGLAIAEEKIQSNSSNFAYNISPKIFYKQNLGGEGVSIEMNTGFIQFGGSKEKLAKTITTNFKAGIQKGKFNKIFLVPEFISSKMIKSIIMTSKKIGKDSIQINDPKKLDPYILIENLFNYSKKIKTRIGISEKIMNSFGSIKEIFFKKMGSVGLNNENFSKIDNIILKIGEVTKKEFSNLEEIKKIFLSIRNKKNNDEDFEDVSNKEIFDQLDKKLDSNFLNYIFSFDSKEIEEIFKELFKLNNVIEGYDLEINERYLLSIFKNYVLDFVKSDFNSLISDDIKDVMKYKNYTNEFSSELIEFNLKSLENKALIEKDKKIEEEINLLKNLSYNIFYSSEIVNGSNSFIELPSQNLLELINKGKFFFNGKKIIGQEEDLGGFKIIDNSIKIPNSIGIKIFTENGNLYLEEKYNLGGEINSIYNQYLEYLTLFYGQTKLKKILFGNKNNSSEIQKKRNKDFLNFNQSIKTEFINKIKDDIHKMEGYNNDKILVEMDNGKLVDFMIEKASKLIEKNKKELEVLKKKGDNGNLFISYFLNKIKKEENRIKKGLSFGEKVKMKMF